MRQAVDVSIAAAADEREWDTYVLSHADATGHHCWGWRRVIEDAFGYPTEYLVARRNAVVVGVLPLVCFRSALFGRAVISLPFLNYGGVLADDDDVARGLLKAAGDVAVRERARYVELRHRQRQFPELPAREHKVAMRKRLPSSAEDAWEELDRKVRNQVRKAQKSGLSVITGGAPLVRSFYRVFAENMRDLGTPVYSRRLFEAALKHFPEHFQLVLVQRGARTIAGGCAYVFRDTVEVHWAGSLKTHRSLCPNHLLYWTVIDSATRLGLRVLDFGRSTPGEGTYHFKLQWGAEPSRLSWEYMLFGGAEAPDHGPTNPKFRAAIEVWKRLPLVVANLAGPAIVRAIP